nr:hypothetical protein Iba_chr05fCG12070 [Ipomoea batatas]
MLLHGLALGNRSKIVKMSYGGLKATPPGMSTNSHQERWSSNLDNHPSIRLRVDEWEVGQPTSTSIDGKALGLAVGKGNKIVKMMSYGGVKATPEAVAVNPLNGDEYSESSRTVIGPPSPKANSFGHQVFAPPPIVSLVMTSKLLPPPPRPPRRLRL